MLFPLLLLLGQGVAGRAASLRSGEHCPKACQYTLRTVHFGDAAARVPKPAKLCSGAQAISSLFLCLRTYCTPETTTDGLNIYNETCQAVANTTLPSFEFVANYTHDDVAQLRKLQRDEAMRAVNANETVIPSERLFQLTFDTIDISLYEYNTHKFYGWVMYYFWAVVVSIGLCTKLLSLILSIKQSEWQPLPGGLDESLEGPSPSHKVGLLRLPAVLLKKYVTVPATFGYRCAQNVKWCTVPPRVQSLTIALFVLLNIVLCSINYYTFSDNMYWPEEHTQLLRYVSDRTGIISFANFPLIWLFGARNNVLMWLTGWGFGTYNNFHRWVARVATVQAVVHSIGYTIMVFESGGWDYFARYWTRRWWWTGEVATITMCLLSALSVYGLRRSFYEVFLVSHIVVSLVVLVTMWYHVEIFNGEYDIFFWPCVFIWAVDRFLRLLRVLWYNPRFWTTKASTIYNPSSGIVRLIVPDSHRPLKAKPGTYYYLYILNDSRFWESHPFTLAYATKPGQTVPLTSHVHGTLSPTYRSCSPANAQPSNRSSSELSTETETLLVPTVPPSSLVFLIRPYDGFTSRLRDSAFNAPSTPRVLVEGPYGHTHPLHTFESVLFIVGGSGIALPLSYLDQILNESSQTTSVKIVWAMREQGFLEEVLEEDLKNLASWEKLSLSVYLTKETVDKNDRPSDWPPELELHCGRPDVEQEVREAAKESASGRLAVVSCGPAQMADDARRAVVRALGKGRGQIEYYEESFKW